MDEITRRAITMVMIAERQRSGDADSDKPVTPERAAALAVELGLTAQDVAVVLRAREIKAMPKAQRALLLRARIAELDREAE